MDLRNLVVVVTGAGSGMGRATARRLCAEGAKVVAVGRTAEKLAATIADPPGPGQLVAKPADVSKRNEVERLMREVADEFGPIRLLVNNAGVNIVRRKLEELSLDDWDHLIAVNLNGAFYMLHAALGVMRANGGGLIINISSVAAKRPSPLGGAAYTASKYGLNGLSGVVSLEERKNNIRSTVICPGEVNTPILDQRPVPISADRRATMLQPEDIADAVLFVAKLPDRCHIPELIIKPANQEYQ